MISHKLVLKPTYTIDLHVRFGRTDMRTTQHERTEYKPIWNDLPILIQITPNPLMFMLIDKYLGRYLS